MTIDRDTEPKHSPESRSASEALPDGAEAPPPGVRTMAVVRWALVLLMAVAAAGAWTYWARTTAREEQDEHRHAQYRCPMHPAVLQERPGSCPICGMDLVLATSGPLVTPPKAASASVTAPAGAYWCPMHPEVTSDDPNARCDKCGGMKLVPRAAADQRSGVSGLAAVTIGPERSQLIGVRTAIVAKQRVAPQLRTVGFISANENALALVTARVVGWIEDLRVAQSGQHVAKGQVLATVYSPDLLAAQQAFINTVRWADKQAATQKAPSPGLDSDARRRLELYGMSRQDIADIQRTGEALNAVPIRAPVNGYIARKSALAGLYVQPGSEMFQIVDLSTVWVVADVYEHEMARVRVGQAARLTLGAYPGEAFTGRVQFIYPAVNPETRTLQARMEFRNPGLKLRPGMYADVVIEGAPAESLAIPSEALVETGESQYVFVAKAEGRFEPRRIRTGQRRDDRVEVLEGLEAGERVVTTANFLVDSESRLQAAVEQFRAHP